MYKDIIRKINTGLLNGFQLFINLSILGTAIGYSVYTFFDLCWPDILEDPKEVLFGLFLVTVFFLGLILYIIAVILIESVLSVGLALTLILLFKSKKRVTRLIFAIIDTVILLISCASAVFAGIFIWNLADYQILIILVFVAEGIAFPWCLAVLAMHIAKFVTTKKES